MGAPQYEQAGADVAGSGTTNTIPRWTGPSTLGDSRATDDGTTFVVGSGAYAGTALPGGMQLKTTVPIYVATDGTRTTIVGTDGTTSCFVGSLTNHNFQIRANNAIAITVQPGGNVGIGTASPASRLDVAGTITCDDAGTGLKLPATPGNADAQTLDCYQENPLATTAGNGWTPTIGGTAAQWGGTLPTVSFARYVQIGSIVFCDVRLTSASIQSTYGVTTITPPLPAQNAFATEVVVPASTTSGGVSGNGAQFGGVVYLPTLAASTAIRLTWFYLTTS